MSENTCSLARKHLGIDDAQVIQLVLCAGVSVYDSDEDPLWPMLVGPPSAGKTTVTSLTGALNPEVMDDPTFAGLLTRNKDGEQVGVLERLGKRGLIVIPDFSTLLAGSKTGQRDQLFAHLRRIYDGETSRDMAGGRLTWHGRAIVIGAVTSAIDTFTAYQAELGPRFVYLRYRAHDVEDKIARLRSSRGLIREMAGVQQAARRAVERASLALSTVNLSERLHGMIEMAALVCAYGRTSVPRDGYRRDVIGLAETEEPYRLRNQLTSLGRAGLALGLAEEEIESLVFRVARDSMPQSRLRVLFALSKFNGVQPTTAQVAHSLGMNWSVADRALEDLSLSEMVDLMPVDNEDQAHHKKWCISTTFSTLLPCILHDSHPPRF